MIKALRKHSLAKIGCSRKSCIGCLPCFFAKSGGWLKTLRKIATRIDVRQQRPAKSELRIQAHCFFEVFLRGKGVRRCKCSL